MDSYLLSKMKQIFEIESAIYVLIKPASGFEKRKGRRSVWYRSQIFLTKSLFNFKSHSSNLLTIMIMIIDFRTGFVLRISAILQQNIVLLLLFIKLFHQLPDLQFSKCSCFIPLQVRHPAQPRQKAKEKERKRHTEREE